MQHHTEWWKSIFFSFFLYYKRLEGRRKKYPSKISHHHQLSNFGKVIDRILYLSFSYRFTRFHSESPNYFVSFTRFSLCVRLFIAIDRLLVYFFYDYWVLHVLNFYVCEFTVFVVVSSSKTSNFLSFIVAAAAATTVAISLIFFCVAQFSRLLVTNLFSHRCSHEYANKYISFACVRACVHTKCMWARRVW